MPCSPGMKKCRAGCLHRLMVQEYYAARDAWEEELEETAIGYETEEKEFRRDHPQTTFKEWLIGRANPNPGG